MAKTDLGRRLIVAGIGIPLGVLIIYLGVWFVAGLLSVVAALGAREIYRMAEGSGGRPFHSLGIAASALLVLGAGWAGSLSDWGAFAIAILVSLALASLASSVFSRTPGDAPLASTAITVLGAVYVGATLGFGVHLRSFPGVADGRAGWDGALLLIFPLFVTWIGDSAAYFAGHRWGRRKLLPAVSPGKTIAGACGGLLGAVVGASLFSVLLINAYVGVTLSWRAAALMGLLLGCIAQVGDLAESLLKRESGVKDSGSLFPGHGGVLDRFDSVFFTLPITYALFLLVLNR